MVRVQSENLNENQVKNTRDKVNSLKAYGYSNMAILYFIGQEYSASATYEGGEFVINLR